MIDFDVETTGIQWYHHDIFLATFLRRDSESADVFRLPESRDEVQQMLLADAGGFRAWNSKFDLHFLDAGGFSLPPESSWHDGMVQAHIVNAERSLALKAVAGEMFGDDARYDERRVKDWLTKEAAKRRKENKENGGPFVPPHYGDVPEEIMVPYAEQDVILTRDICDQFDLVMHNNPELRGLYEFEMEVLAALFYMEKRGVPVDEELARKFEHALVMEVEEHESFAIELAGKSNFNPNSSQQLHEALRRAGADLRFCTRTKSGTSMDAESLATVDHPLADTVLRFRSDNKVLGTYVRPLLHSTYDASLRCEKAAFIQNGRVHPSINQVGARSGRMSCSDPNMQNWPRDDLRLRYLVRAEPGNKLVTADLDSIELRLFAAYAGGEFKEAFLRGEDQHAATAARVGLCDRKRNSGAIESARQRGKTFNYAMIYGAGVRSLRKAFGVSQEEARQMIQRYHAAYPEVLRLQRDVEYRLQSRGYVKTAWGRRQRIPAREAYKAVNYMIQGSAAEILKAAAVRLHKEGVPLVLPVHDELLVECAESDAPEVAHMLEEALTDHPRISEKMPLAADAKIVTHWSEAKDPTYKPEYAND